MFSNFFFIIPLKYTFFSKCPDVALAFSGFPSLTVINIFAMILSAGCCLFVYQKSQLWQPGSSPDLIPHHHPHLLVVLKFSI